MKSRLQAKLGGSKANQPAVDELGVLRKQVAELKHENDQLRASLANSESREQLRRDNERLQAAVTSLARENEELKTELANHNKRAVAAAAVHGAASGGNDGRGEDQQDGKQEGAVRHEDEIDVGVFALCGVRHDKAEADRVRECQCLAALAHAQAAQRAVTFFSLQDALLSQAVDGARPHLEKLEGSLFKWAEAHKAQLVAPLKGQIADLERLRAEAKRAEDATKSQFFALRRLTTKPVTVAMNATKEVFVDAFDALGDSVLHIAAAVQRLNEDHRGLVLRATDIAERQRNGATDEECRTGTFLQQLYAIGQAVRGPLARLLETVADEARAHGGKVEVQMGRLKGLERVFEKTMEENGGDFSRLGDIVRGSLVCDGVESVVGALDRLSAHCGARVSDGRGEEGEEGEEGKGEGEGEGEGKATTIKSLQLVRVKNRLDPRFDAGAESGGYRDVLVNVVVGADRAAVFGHDQGRPGTEGGLVFLVCEVQVHLRSFHDIKGAGGAHRLYKQARSLHLLDKELGQVFVHGTKESFDEAMDLVERGACRGFSADYFELDEAKAARLVAALLDRSACSVQTISLRNSSLGKVAGAFDGGPPVHGLREVVLSGNDGIAGAFVARFVCKQLCVLRLRDCHVGSEGCRLIARQLGGALGLQELDLAGNAAGSEGAKEIASALRVLTNLTKLDLNDNNFGVDGAKELAPALEVLTNLTMLDLGRNNMGSDGAKEVAPALKALSSLTALYLGDNELGSGGAREIAPALKSLTKLTTLGLGGNSVGGEGAKEIALALKALPNFTIWYLGRNDIGSDGAKEFAPALGALTNLTTLTLASNHLGSDGAKAIAPALQALTNLSTLGLHNNEIGNEGSKEMAPALKALTKLSMLGLDKNNIGLDGANEMAPVLKALTSLTELRVGGNEDDAIQLLQASAPPNCNVVSMLMW